MEADHHAIRSISDLRYTDSCSIKVQIVWFFAEDKLSGLDRPENEVDVGVSRRADHHCLATPGMDRFVNVISGIATSQ
jgi:hypothetical protein